MPLQATDFTDADAPEKEYLWTLNFGPQHPATHTTLRLVLTLDGERVVKAVPDIGFLHSGFEKLAENLTYNQYVTIVDRMNYISPIANEIAWFHAVEKLFEIELTPRGRYVRTIFAELMRVHDHLLNIGTVALDLGAMTGFLYAFNLRERINDICELASGQRFHSSYCRLGGVMFDVGNDWVELVRQFVRDFPKTHEEVHRLLTRNRIFMDRTIGIGTLTREDAIDFGVTGPLARASGVVRDLRKDEPYLAYPDFDFQVVCGKAGDCYARYLVRMAELTESVRLISAALENIPAGPINIGLNNDPEHGKATLPNKADVYRSIEGLIQQFELIMPNRGFPAPVGEVYGATEAPNGELGFYVVADGTAKPFRARTRPPSFIHFAVFPHIIRDHQLSDVVAVLGSLNIIAAELDR